MTERQIYQRYNEAYADNETDAFFQGHIVGMQLRGIGANPYHWTDPRAAAWEDGYKCGRADRERR